MPRIWVWLQLIIGWLPIGALFTVLIMSAHGIAVGEATGIAIRMVGAAAVRRSTRCCGCCSTASSKACCIGMR